jgi:serine/threonine protein kinase
MSTKSNWTTVTESKYPWERDALDFVRAKFPPHEPYRAWANFEFIADDGSINEVDLLVFTPQGFFLIEIKSRPGRLFGDAGTWTWENDGKLTTLDSPLIAANQKAKKLRSLLQRQKAFQKKGQVPFVEALVFCSPPDLKFDLQGNARLRVCLRDRERSDAAGGRPGILAAIMRRECPGLDTYARGTHDRPMGKAVAQAIDQAGIRPSQRHRKVSDYVLEHLLAEGPGYQDWHARHTQLQEAQRRVRLYLVRTGSTAEDRKTIERAALREFQLLVALQHPGVLRAYGFTEHEVGPALIFEHDPLSIRLDHFLAQANDRLRVETRLDLLRQIAEVIRFAHDEKVVHRSLSPQNILVTDTATDRPRIKIFNWQAGYRAASSSSGVSHIVSATSHVDRLVEDSSTAYMAPEAFNEGDNTGEHLDVFSLGAIAYHIFSGQPPAANGLELSNKLRETKGLQISSILNGAGECLQYLVQYSTNPVVPDRTGSVVDFLDDLDAVEKELTTPDRDYVEDPNRAQIDDVLPGDLHVLKRLGQGACSVALLVERDGQLFVLKVANDAEHNSRLKDEAEVLRKDEMRHPCIVDFVESVEIGNRSGFLLRPVFAEKEKQLVETLGHRLRKEGRLHIELLQRFGEDLLGVLNHLEEQGIPHRDIKPDNIAVGMVGRGNKLHLVVFDFSLSHTPLENIRAGTSGYLDPLLPLRDATKPKWDLYAERYAAAATLYEMATGGLPKWGDGSTDPSHLNCEATIEAEVFDVGLREGLVEFFQKAFRRNPKERFDNAEAMLIAWRDCFKDLETSGTISDHQDESQLRELLASATMDTQIPELGLGTRATNALDRANILTVEDLLSYNVRRLQRLRGIGNKTRREIMTAVRILRERLGKPDQERVVSEEESTTQLEGVGSLSVDALAGRLMRIGSREGETTQRTLQLFLGFDTAAADPWPSQSDVARTVDVTRARIGQLIAKFQERWAKDPGITRLRSDLVDIVAAQGGVMSAAELAEAVIVARGCIEEEPRRTRLALAVVRAAVEVERTMAEPQLLIRRDGNAVFIAQSMELANYSGRLGELADRLADEDPLVAPSRVVERLREVTPPEGVMLSDARLVRLAAVASQHAEVSSKQELYPRGMSPQRAIKLAHGAIAGVPQLSVAEIRERIASRYPNAAPLPNHPELYELLKEAGFDVEWDPAGKGGAGSYVSRYRDNVSVTSGSQSLSRWPTAQPQLEAGEITPDQADARQFEERLQRSVKDGAFLTLLVNPKNYQRAADEICRRFPVELIDLEGVFLDALREVAGKANVNWELVLQTDAKPGEGDWDKLMLLVGRVMPLVELRLASAERTMLVIYAGLLARYNRMDLLERLRDKVGRRDGIQGLWLLIPGDHQAMLDGKAVPIISPGQRARIPESWLKNAHRGNGNLQGNA